MNQSHLSGILSNWDKIEAGIRAGLHDDYGKSKDIQDVLDIIHDLQFEANTVTPLRELFNLHVTDTKNPHHVTIAVNELDVLTALYGLYTEKFGTSMSITDFGYTLVNLKKMATRADVDSGTNLDSLMNIDVMDYMIGLHNVAPDAHEELFRYKIPGLPLSAMPASVFEPNLGVTNYFVVERACPINYHDINGRVKVAPNDILPIDHSYGFPTAPIFDTHRNIMTNSRDLTDTVLHGVERNINNDLLVVTPLDDIRCMILREYQVMSNHGFRDTVFEEMTGPNNYSIYVYPLDRDKLVVTFIDSVYGAIGTIVFDCSDLGIYLSGTVNKLIGEILPLQNGWFRCSAAFDATMHHITGFDVDILDAINTDGTYDKNYEGGSDNAMAFWQHQITKTVLAAPPIFTYNNPVSVLSTKVKQEFTDIFNPTHGSIMFRYVSPMSERFSVPSVVCRLGDVDTPTHTSIGISTSSVDPARIRIINYNNIGEVLGLLDSDPYDGDAPIRDKRVAFTYTLGFQGYGFTDQSPVVFELAIDRDQNQMETFFTDIYGVPVFDGSTILQLPDRAIMNNDGDVNQLVGGSLSNDTHYRINEHVTVLEIGYDSTSGLFMNGYLIGYKYYSVFSSEMNLEFLLDQYVPKN